MEYQGRTLVPIKQIIKKSNILTDLEAMVGDGEQVFIDVKPALYKFKKGQGPNFQKYYVYKVKKDEEFKIPMFLISVDRLLKCEKKTLRYRIV